MSLPFLPFASLHCLPIWCVVVLPDHAPSPFFVSYATLAVVYWNTVFPGDNFMVFPFFFFFFFSPSFCLPALLVSFFPSFLVVEKPLLFIMDSIIPADICVPFLFPARAPLFLFDACPKFWYSVAFWIRTLCLDAVRQNADQLLPQPLYPLSCSCSLWGDTRFL